MKLVFATTCKPLHNDKIKIMQYNSIRSWNWLSCDKKILVFNRDISIKNMCSELNVINVEDYESSDSSDLPTWRTMRDVACNYCEDDDYIVWVNSDIIFDDTIYITINQLIENKIYDFILTGKRKNWKDWFELSNKLQVSNIQFEQIGDAFEIDYFVFNKRHFSNLPKFYIARMRFDNYLMNTAIMTVDKTIDCTHSINSYHHSHGYGNDLDKSFSEEFQSDKYTKELRTNQTLNTISSINDCKYKLELKDRKIIFI